MTVHTYGATTVEVSQAARTVVTTLADGATVVAAPEDNEAYRARAASLGYTGPDATWEMCVDHERCHSQLAHTLGLPASPALWHVAHPEEEWEPDLVDYEERVVLLLQRKGWV